MIAPRPSLAAALRVERTGDWRFCALMEDGRPDRVFGGQVMAVALLAAGTTVSGDLGAHVLHSRFLWPGDPHEPIEFTVEPAEDRGAFAHRRVVAGQGATRILDLTVSFHRDESGPEFEPTAVAVAVEDPERLPTLGELAERVDGGARRWWQRLEQWLPVEMRSSVLPGRWTPAPEEPVLPRQSIWVRSFHPLDAPLDAVPPIPERLGHAASAVYVSDLFMLTAAMVRHGVRHDDPGVLCVTLNHSMWFHRPFRADEWFVHEQEGFWSGAGRMLSRGQMFDRAGRLVATTMQEGLMRVSDESLLLASARLPR
ncbi:acyl-CoA thioesterase [Jatrophihabitans fulvus]